MTKLVTTPVWRSDRPLLVLLPVGLGLAPLLAGFWALIGPLIWAPFALLAIPAGFIAMKRVSRRSRRHPRWAHFAVLSGVWMTSGLVTGFAYAAWSSVEQGSLSPGGGFLMVLAPATAVLTTAVLAASTDRPEPAASQLD